MSQSLVFTLLMLALVLPVLGAVVLRVLTPRLAPIQLYGAAALIFGVAFVSVLALARSNISSLQIGRLSLLLPVAAPADQAVLLPSLPVAPPSVVPPTSTVTLEPTESPVPTAAPPTVSTPPATEVPTAVPPTAVPPTPEPPTPEPVTAVPPTPEPPTPEPTTAPPARRTYTVQAGDTLRGIAEQFNVSVQSIIDANNLTAAEADSLHVGQELVIP